MTVFWMFTNAGVCAFDAALFAATGNPLTLGLAIFCGFGALALLAQDVTR